MLTMDLFIYDACVCSPWISLYMTCVYAGTSPPSTRGRGRSRPLNSQISEFGFEKWANESAAF